MASKVASSSPRVQGRQLADEAQTTGNEYRNSFGLPKGLGYPNIAPDGDFGNLVDQGADLTYEDNINWEQAIGWIPIWGLAYDGAEGVKLAVDLLHEELMIAMALAGCKTIKDINKSHLSILQQETGILSGL
ncbi:hypothetical protein ACJZ2D_003223 [Fusarium nematophilum]